MQITDLESVRGNVREAAGLFLKHAGVGDTLAAYGDMPTQTEGRVFVAAEHALCVIEAGEEKIGSRHFVTATCRAIPWSEVRGFAYQVMYATDPGASAPIITRHTLKIEEPEFAEVAVTHDERLRDFGRECQRRVLAANVG